MRVNSLNFPFIKQYTLPLIWVLFAPSGTTLSATNLPAQQVTKTILTGRIIDTETGDFLENVNVFLSTTTLGTSTMNDGMFSISDVPIGVFNLVFSRVGYERQIISLHVVKPESLHYEIRLTPEILQTKEIKVEAADPKEWKENLKQFIKIFIGETENSDRCRILNPEVINLDINKTTNTLVASSDSIIRIENRALGYRVNLILDRFNWDLTQDIGEYHMYTRFEELETHNNDEKHEWPENRKKCYEGSLKHFLISLVTGKIKNGLFAISLGTLKSLAKGFGHIVNADELLALSEPESVFKKMSFNGYLMVKYQGSQSSPSFMKLENEYALVDMDGNLLDPLSVKISGAWARDRVASLLPSR